jgi:hypothetical protein
MKKSLPFLAIFLACAIGNVFSQDNRFITGGSLGFSFTSSKSKESDQSVLNNHVTDFSGNPFFGYFINEHLVLGAGLEFVVDKVKYVDPVLYDYDKSTDFMFVPFMRYYFDGSLFMLAEFQVGKSVIKFSGDNDMFSGTVKYNFRTLGAGVGFGYDIRLSDHVCLEPVVLYNFKSKKQTDAEEGADMSVKQQLIFLKLGLVYRF